MTASLKNGYVYNHFLDVDLHLHATFASTDQYNVANILRDMGMGSHLPLLQVTLPVGISFFTFMGISYVVDVYRGEIVPAPLLDFAVYLSFFPHLVAGPIVRGSELLPQLREPKDPRRVDASITMSQVYAAAVPYIVFGLIVLVAIFLFPPIATWLPAVLGN